LVKDQRLSTTGADDDSIVRSDRDELRDSRGNILAACHIVRSKLHSHAKVLHGSLRPIRECDHGPRSYATASTSTTRWAKDGRRQVCRVSLSVERVERCG